MAQEEDHEPSPFIQVTMPPRLFTEGFLVHAQNDHDRLSKIARRHLEGHFYPYSMQNCPASCQAHCLLTCKHTGCISEKKQKYPPVPSQHLALPLMNWRRSQNTLAVLTWTWDVI